MPSPAELPSWIYGYVLLFALAHGAALYYLYRSTASTTVADSEASSETDTGESGRVVCEHCGAENELGYRYCRNCVQELSDAVGRPNAERSAASRGIL